MGEARRTKHLFQFFEDLGCACSRLERQHDDTLIFVLIYPLRRRPILLSDLKFLLEILGAFDLPQVALESGADPDHLSLTRGV